MEKILNQKEERRKNFFSIYKSNIIPSSPDDRAVEAKRYTVNFVSQ